METEWNAGGPARAAGGRNSDFIRGFSRILQIEDRGILRLVQTRLETRRVRRIVSPSGPPPTLSHCIPSDLSLHLAFLPPCEALVVGLEVRREAAKNLMNLGGPRVSWEFRFASEHLLAYLITYSPVD